MYKDGNVDFSLLSSQNKKTWKMHHGMFEYSRLYTMVDVQYGVFES